MRIVLPGMLLLSLLYAGAEKTWTMGDVYPFAEKDMLEDIQEHVRNNESTIKKRLEEQRTKMKKQSKEWKPNNMQTLAPALKNKTFWPDMNYTTTEVIRDHNGKVLYPKGFTFNPLKYLPPMQNKLVVIDATDPEQLVWIKDQNITNNMNYKILISDGKAIELSEQLKQPIFYLLPSIKRPFKIPCQLQSVTQSYTSKYLSSLPSKKIAS
jgi:conjugal transfer pilus assembly protein TraW